MTNTTTSRRSFVASTASLLGLGGLGKISALAAETQDVTPSSSVTLTPEIEPLVRLIESTKREDAVEMMVGQIKKGVPVNQFVAAMFLVATRINVSPHHVFMIHAALRTSQQLEKEHQLLPLFWALDTTLYRREEGQRYPAVKLKDGLSAEQASKTLHRAMAYFDAETAESALISLARRIGPRKAMSELWKYAGRDDGFIGHRAIAISNSWRVLETIGWEHAEPVLQFVARRLNAGRRRHLQHRENLERSENMQTIPQGWNKTVSDPDATLELFNEMCLGDAGTACQAAHDMLASGKVQAGTIWDAVFLLGADFMARFPNSISIGGVPVHTNTSANALRFAYETCGTPNVQLYTLLAAVSWATGYYGIQVERKTLRDTGIMDIDLVDVGDSNEEVAAEVFPKLQNRRYDVTQEQILRGRVGKRQDMDRAAQFAFSYATKHADHRPFLNTARLLTSIKSTQDAHDMKFPAAIYENHHWIHAKWKPHLLAASTHYLHGTNMIDNPAVLRAKQAAG